MKFTDDLYSLMATLRIFGKNYSGWGLIGKTEGGHFNMFFSVWPDGVNFRSLKSMREDATISRLFGESTVAEIPKVEFECKAIEEDIKEELEGNPNGLELVKRRFENGFGDCIYTWPSIGPDIVVSEKAFRLLNSEDGTFSQTSVDGYLFFVFHCTRVLNCLSPKSEIAYLPSGTPSEVTRYEFTDQVEVSQLFFRIGWGNGRLLPELFATERLYRLVTSNDLRGFRLKPLVM